MVSLRAPPSMSSSIPSFLSRQASSSTRQNIRRISTTRTASSPWQRSSSIVRRDRSSHACLLHVRNQTHLDVSSRQKIEQRRAISTESNNASAGPDTDTNSDLHTVTPSPSPSTLAPGAVAETQTTSTTTPSPPQTALPASLLQTLPLLHLQSVAPTSAPSLYCTIHIHSRPYLVTLGDRIRLPFLMPGVSPGDILRLTHASTLGTRDYTLRGAPWVDSRVFEVRATVGSVESEPMRVMHKTKRRVRKIKNVRSKHRYTELLVSELRVRSLGEIAAEEA